MNKEARGVRAGHQVRWRSERTVTVDWNDESFLRTETVGVLGDALQAVPVGHRRGTDQLNKPDVCLLPQVAQVALLERLDEDRGVPTIPASRSQRFDERLLERQLDAPKVRRMFGLRIDADGPPAGCARLLREREHFIKGRDLKLTVVGVRAEWQPLARAKRLDFRQREVLAEPTAHRLAVDHPGALAIREPLGDIGRAAEFVLVPRDQDAVLRRDEIRLDEIRAHLDRESVRLERVLGSMAARAAVGDDERPRRSDCRQGHPVSPHSED